MIHRPYVTKLAHGAFKNEQMYERNVNADLQLGLVVYITWPQLLWYGDRCDILLASWWGGSETLVNIGQN